MSDDQAFDPYRYSEPKDDPAPPIATSEPDARRRLNVLAGFLAFMGAWGVLFNGLRIAIAAVRILTAPTTLGGPTHIVVRTDAPRFTTEAAALMVSVDFLLGMALLAVAIGLLRRRAWGRKYGLRVILVCVCWTLTEFGIWALVSIWRISRAIQVGVAPFPDVGGVDSGIHYVSLGVGIALQLLLYSAEFAIYAYGWRYLRSDAGRAQFVRPALA